MALSDKAKRMIDRVRQEATKRAGYAKENIANLKGFYKSQSPKSPTFQKGLEYGIAAARVKKSRSVPRYKNLKHRITKIIGG